MNPEIRLTEPETANTTEHPSWKGSVIIFPGGGYQWHSPRESEPVARAFALAGWKPWILYYPVAPSGNGAPLGLAPLRCAAAAVKQVRLCSAELPVVLCGFSAGGHAAASLGVHWNDTSVFTLEEQSIIRPDALILSYPVITAGPWAHWGSIQMLTGTKEQKSPEDRQILSENERDISYFSLEYHVTAQTPPVFLWHTASDESVPVRNSLLFAESLAACGVPYELHIYPYGPHGLSLATPEVEDPAKHRYADSYVAAWFSQCISWLDLCLSRGLLPVSR